MKRKLNLDLLEFHVREAAQELDLLQDVIQYAKDGTHREGAIGDKPLLWPKSFFRPYGSGSDGIIQWLI